MLKIQIFNSLFFLGNGENYELSEDIKNSILINLKICK